MATNIKNISEISDDLISITFGDEFNQNIEKVIWPKSLTSIVFGYWFNQPVEKVIWPNSLTSLKFGYTFNHKITNLQNISYLTFYYKYKHYNDINKQYLCQIKQIDANDNEIIIFQRITGTLTKRACHYK